MKVLIIEDEKPAARRVVQLLMEVDPSIQILAILDSIEASVEWLKLNTNPELIFLDIHLADGSSFEIFKKVEVRSPIIFITAFNEYAIDAFKVNSIDYLLKPLKKVDLEQAFLKYKNMQFNFSQLAIDGLVQNLEKKYKDRFVVRLGNKIISVMIDEIAYFYSKDKLSFISDKQGRSLPIDLSLDKIETLVNPLDFFRVNRQIIAHSSSIKEIQTSSKSRIILDLLPASPVEALISSERSSVFKKWLKRE
jgi:DNA-binding LytR/AlgR family response regulator